MNVTKQFFSTFLCLSLLASTALHAANSTRGLRKYIGTDMVAELEQALADLGSTLFLR